MALDANVAVAIAELTFGADTRDDTNYPTSGFNVFVSAGKGDRLDRRGRSFSKVYTNMDYFIPVGKGVIAAELTLGHLDLLIFRGRNGLVLVLWIIGHPGFELVRDDH